MITFASIVDGPVGADAERLLAAHRAARPSGDTGAVLRFEGVVRRAETDGHGLARPLIALEYRAYEPMATRQLAQLAAETAQRHALTSCLTLHSRGRVPVDRVSFLLEVSAAHRAEAIAGLADFIDRLKQDVPIWKQPVWV